MSHEIQPQDRMSCPGPDVLAAFQTGKLSEDRLEAVADHLAECTSCQATVHGLDGLHDTIVSHIRRGEIGDAYAVEAEFQQGLRHAKAIRPGQSAERGNQKARDPLADRESLGAYTLQQKLGAGGMGVVYRAEHSHLKMTVALKVLPAHLLERSETVDRFQREMQAIGKLDHPNIVRATDAGEIDGVHFLVMEYVAGRDLSSIVKSDGPLPVDLAIRCILQAARGMAYVHGQGIVHRDIKPGNILLTNDEHDAGGQTTVKVLDLGLARLQTETGQGQAGNANQNGAELTRTGTVMGTVDYMAPEQALNTAGADARSDVYSLGCTLFYLLTGQPPYGGGSVVEQIIGHRERPIPSLIEARPGVPPELDRVFARMVAKEPQDRYQTMDEVVQALESLQPVAALAPAASTTRRESSSVKPRSAPSPSGRFIFGRGLRIGGAIAGCLAAAFFLWYLAGVIFRFETPEGTLVLEVDDPDVVVKIDGETQQVTVDRNNQRLMKLSVVPGKGLIEVETKDGLRFFAERFEVAPGKTTRIRVKWISKAESFATGASWPLGPEGDVLTGLITRPARLPGIRRWQMDLAGPQLELDSVVWSPDGKYIACACFDGQVRVYDAENLKLVRILDGYAPPFGLAWDPTGKWLAFSSGKRPTVLWDVERGTQGPHITHDGFPQSGFMSWSPEGDRLAFSDGVTSVIRVWRLSDGVFEQTIQTGGRSRLLAWSPDGSSIAQTGEKHIAVWKAVDGKLAQKWDFEFDPRTASICWSPDGKRLAWGGEDGIYSAAANDDHQPQRIIDSERPVWKVAWSPDGGLLAGTDQAATVTLWSASDYSKSHTLVSQGGYYRSIDWSPDGKKLSLGTSRAIELWDAMTGKLTSQVIGSWDRQFEDVHWSPDGRQLAAGNVDHVVRLWSADGQPMAKLAGDRAAWNPNGDVVATLGDDLRIWNREGRVIHKSSRLTETPLALAWHPNGTLLATGHRTPKGKTTIHVWDRQANAKHGIELDELAPMENALVWSPDGTRLVTGHQSGAVLYVDPADGSIVRQQELPGYINDLAWRSDAKTLAVAFSAGVSLLTNGEVQTAQPGGGWACLSWRPDSKRMVVGHQTSGALAFLDAANLKTIKTWQGHRLGARSLDYQPDSQSIASVSYNRLRLWKDETAEPIWAAVVTPKGKTITFSGAGQLLHAEADALDELVYIVERDDGARDILSVDEFQTLIEQPGEKQSLAEPETDPSASPLAPEDDILPGLITRPAKLPGIRRWQVEFVAPQMNIRSVAWSPGAKYVACSGYDDQVRVYEAESLKLVRVFGYRRSAAELAWNPSGRWLAVPSGDGVTLWDVERGSKGPSVPRFAQLAWSPDGEQLAMDDASGIDIWNLADRAFVRTIPTGDSRYDPLAWSPNGKWIAQAGDRYVAVWNASDGKEEHTWKLEAESRLSSIAWRPDSSRLAWASDQGIHVVEFEAGRKPTKLCAGGAQKRVAWCAGADVLAATCAGEIKLFRGDDYSLIRSIPAHSKGLEPIAWSPDGKKLASGSSGTLQIWDAAASRLISEVTSDQPVRLIDNLSWSPDSQLLAAGGGDNVVRLWSADGKPASTLSGTKAAWHPSGQSLAASGVELGIWSREGRLLRRHRWPERAVALAWSPDGSQLATGHDGKPSKVQIWDDKANLRHVIEFEESESELRALAWHPDGSQLAAGMLSGAVLYLNPADGSRLGETKPSDHYINGLAWSSDGRRLVVAHDGVSLIENGEARSAKPHFVEGCSCVAWSPDDNRIVAVKRPHGELLLIDAATLKSLRVWKGDDFVTQSVAYRPDGRCFASVFYNRIRLWDSDTTEPLSVILVTPQGKSATFSGAGELLHAEADALEELVYIVERDDGVRDILSADEFQKLIARP